MLRSAGFEGGEPIFFVSLDGFGQPLVQCLDGAAADIRPPRRAGARSVAAGFGSAPIRFVVLRVSSVP